MIERLKELLRHSAIYGLGSIVARVLGVLLLPLYTRYLSPSDYGLIETLVALSAVLTALVAQGMKSAFFRFYFDSAGSRAPAPRRAHRLLVRHGRLDRGDRRRHRARVPDLVAPLRHARPPWPRHRSVRRSLGSPELRADDIALPRRAAFDGVRRRDSANVAITIAATILLVVVFDKGPLGVLVGNFTGTLIIYAALCSTAGMRSACSSTARSTAR